MPTKENHLKVAWMQTGLVLGLLFLLVAAGGYLYYQRERESISQTKYEELRAIAQEKARFVTSWLMVKANDAARPARSPFFRKAMEEWFEDPEHPPHLEAWKTRLRMDREAFGYDDVLLLKGDAWSLLLSAQEDPDPVDPFTHEAAENAIAIGGPVLSEPYICQKGTVHMDVVCPVLSLKGDLMAFLVLRIDLRRTLFPSIQSWPTPSPSAETLLVKQDRNHVLFLNDLRHRPLSALSLSIPVSRDELPAVQAVSGKTGMFMGKDYRGVEVLADLRPISGTSWFMVTKVDTSEILKEASYRGAAVAMFVAFSLLLFSSLAALWIRHGRARLWKRLYNSERELRLAQEVFRTILYSIGDAVIATDTRGKVTIMNPVAEALTGWPEQEATGRDLQEVFRILNEESRLPVENPVERVLREGLVVGLANHTLLVSRDGTERPIADSGAPIRDEKGEISGVVLVFRDQTRERALARELERSRRDWHQIFETVGNPSLVLDPELRVIEANQAALRMIGLQKGEVLGKRCYELMGCSQEARMDCPCAALLRDGPRKTPAAKGISLKGRFYITRCTPILDDQGFLEKIIYVAADVTELEEAQEALRLSEGRFRSLVENSSQGLVVVQGERILYANPEALRLMGATMEEVLRAHYLDFTHPEDRELIAERYRRRALGEEVKGTVKFRMRSLSGKVTWVEGYTASIPWDGEKAYLVFLQDLTERRRMEEEKDKLEAQFLQAQKLEAVGRLAGGVAHDFNNMLSVMTGYAELAMAQAPGDETLERHLAEILKATRKSASLVRQLLAFARKQVISPKPLDLNEAITGMLKMLRRLIGEDIHLVWVPGHEIWTVFMDPAQLDQIVANLLVNARDAVSGPGKVTIETQNVRLDEDYCRDHVGFVPGDYVMLAVTDDGCGMDKETMEKIFEPFFTTKGMERGTGLGLSTVYGIVKQNRGFINVYSELGKGTTFKIYIPRYENEGATSEGEIQSPEALPRGTETVLIVEDEPSLVKVYKKFLENLGYKVLAASSPEEALRVADAHQGAIDLLLSDVVMPQMNGRELWETLKKTRPDLNCLFISGYTANAIAHQGVLEEGMNFLGKPFSMAALASKVRETLGSP